MVGYLATALALLGGLRCWGSVGSRPASAPGEGFRCLAWSVYAMLAAALVAVIALPVIAWRLRLCWWFALLAIALVVAPLVLGVGSTNAGAAPLRGLASRPG